MHHVAIRSTDQISILPQRRSHIPSLTVGSYICACPICLLVVSSALGSGVFIISRTAGGFTITDEIWEEADQTFVCVHSESLEIQEQPNVCDSLIRDNIKCAVL
jgi:hypothetical protein